MWIAKQAGYKIAITKNIIVAQALSPLKGTNELVKWVNWRRDAQIVVIKTNLSSWSKKETGL